MKDPKKVKAGIARWKNVSKKDKIKHLSKAGKIGGSVTRMLWRELMTLKMSKGLSTGDSKGA